MAVYKVPQDVEAEDKLVGPFSFRQFVYLGIAGAGIAVGFFLFQVFPLLAMIPAPVVIIFGILALPLRKDQPMETYILAILRFYLKPKLRMWNPDGTITYVEITAPRAIEQHLTKDLMGESAEQRLDYLARIIDSRGWSLKGVVESKNSVKADIAAEAQATNDIMDEDASLSRSIDNLIARKDQQRKQEVVQQMKQAAAPPPQPAVQTPPPAAASDDDEDQNDNIRLQYNPYPTSMHQKVVHTLAEQRQAADQAAKATAEAAKLAKPTVPKQVSPDIMRLAGNDDLSISAIAHEAHRLEDKEEVVINLH